MFGQQDEHAFQAGKLLSDAVSIGLQIGIDKAYFVDAGEQQMSQRSGGLVIGNGVVPFVAGDHDGSQCSLHRLGIGMQHRGDQCGARLAVAHQCVKCAQVVSQLLVHGSKLTLGLGRL